MTVGYRSGGFRRSNGFRLGRAETTVIFLVGLVLFKAASTSHRSRAATHSSSAPSNVQHTNSGHKVDAAARPSSAPSSEERHLSGGPVRDENNRTPQHAFLGAQPVAISLPPRSDIFTPDIPVSLDILSLCARYDYKPRESPPTQRPARRLFLGGNIADDSLETLRVTADEGKNLYHTVVYVEANSTHANFPRAFRFTVGSKNLEQLQKYWNRTAVVVKYVTDLPAARMNVQSGMLRDAFQRQHVLPGWQGAGMQPMDVGVIADADEAWTRDYLLAAMHCEIPELITGPSQSCQKPKIIGRTLVFESSPECITQKRTWHHPDMIIGECIESIGDPNLHKPMPRRYTQPDNPNPLYRSVDLHAGHGGGNNETYFPLWTPDDFRMRIGGVQKAMSTNTESQYGWQAANHNRQPIRFTAYHFHNWFPDIKKLRFKYLSYAHPDPRAVTMGLGMLNNDLKLAVKCAMGRNDSGDVRQRVQGGFSTLVGPVPELFKDKAYRSKRHQLLKEMIAADEASH